MKLSYIGHLLVLLGITVPMNGQFKLGIEAIPATMIAALQKKSVGLVTNHTGKNQKGIPTLEVLRQHGIAVIALLAPEHGFCGTIKAGQIVHDAYSKEFNVPLLSLYTCGEGKKIQEKTVAGIDVLLFDIQDVGMRHYTYLSTLFQVMEAAARYNKQLIVFDRPNPLGGSIEGPLVDTHLQSFISIAPIPLRHGMTLGEMARYFNKYTFDQRVQLQVVPMQGYTRTMELPSALVANVSPNIPTLQACYGYSFLGLLGEIRPCDVGIGTRSPFSLIGLPTSIQQSAHMWQELSDALAKFNIKTTPLVYFNPRKKQNFQGLRLHINNIQQVPSCTVCIKIAQWLKQQGIPLTFSPDFDKAAGTLLLRQAITQEVPSNVLLDFVHNSLQKFYERAKIVYLYDPLPTVVPML